MFDSNSTTILLLKISGFLHISEKSNWNKFFKVVIDKILKYYFIFLKLKKKSFFVFTF